MPVLWHLDGAVAQLGERLLCKQEVIGSIPFTSTTLQIQSLALRVESDVVLNFEHLTLKQS